MAGAKLDADTFDSLWALHEDRNKLETKIGHNTVSHLRPTNEGPHFVIELHNHPIVMLKQHEINFTLAHHNTVTTRARVNKFLNPVGFQVQQKAFAPYVRDLKSGISHPINDSNWVTLVDNDPFGDVFEAKLLDYKEQWSELFTPPAHITAQQLEKAKKYQDLTSKIKDFEGTVFSKIHIELDEDSQDEENLYPLGKD